MWRPCLVSSLKDCCQIINSNCGSVWASLDQTDTRQTFVDVGLYFTLDLPFFLTGFTDLDYLQLIPAVHFSPAIINSPLGILSVLYVGNENTL